MADNTPSHNNPAQARARAQAQAQAGQPPTAKKPGLFQRLFGTGQSNDDLNVAIVPFIDAAGQDHAREIQIAFQNLTGLRARILKETPVLGPDVERTEHLPAAAAQAIGWLSTYEADVVLWGDIPPPGTTFYIHFAAPPPVDADPAGIISPFQPLTLPVGFDVEQLGGLLIATALAAMNVSGDPKTQKRRALVANVLQRAAQDIERIPPDFTSREQASVNAAFANALATFGHLFPGGEVYHRSSLAYAKALKGTMKTESPTNWAYLQRNLGTVLQALGERTDDVTILEQAATAYRRALEVFTLENTPFPWATTQNRLGEVLYRLDLKSGETAGIKEALAIYQSVLKVFKFQSTPLLWSDALNNFGQAAQVLGRELNSAEALERAVAACQQALKARTRDKHPTLWAATQNNMGSALFLLGRITTDDTYYHQALEAFMGARDIYEGMGLTRMVEITDKNIHHAQSRLPEGSTANTDAAMWWLEEGEEDAPKS